MSSLNRRGTTRPRPDTRVDELDLPSLGGHAKQKVILNIYVSLTTENVSQLVRNSSHQRFPSTTLFSFI